MPPLRELPDKTTLIASPAFLIASRCTWSGRFRSAWSPGRSTGRASHRSTN